MELSTVVRGLARQLQPVRDQERATIADLLQSAKIRDRYSVFELLAIIRSWNSRLRASLDTEPPIEKVITGFSATIDKVLVLNPGTESAFMSWLNDHAGDADCQRVRTDIDRLLSGAKGTQDPSLCRTAFHEKLDQLFSRENGVRELLGGAAASMVDVLAELGIAARIHTQWWPVEYSKLVSPKAGRIVLDELGGSCAVVSASRSEQNHPKRVSYILQVQKGEKFCGIPAPDTERHIYTVTQPWTSAQPSMLDDNGTSVTFGQWPSYRRFLSAKVDGEVLKIKDGQESALRELASEHRYVILSGLAVNSFEPVLKSQLTTLIRNGSILHLEISGDFFKDDTSKDRRTRQAMLEAAKVRLGCFVSDVREVGIQSVSLNDEQLSQLATYSMMIAEECGLELAGRQYPVRELIQIAAEFGIALDVSRIYLHTTSADVVLRRGGTPAIMRQEVCSDLFAKGALVAALFRRANPTTFANRVQGLPPVLLAGGFRSLIDVAGDDTALLKCGYRLAPRMEYSLAIVPVLWPTSPPEITSSAGDISSAVQFVLAGL